MAVGAVLAMATGVQALLITRVWDPLWNPFRPSPEQILLQSFAKAKELASFRTSTNVHAEVFQRQEKILGVSLTATGDTQRSTQTQSSQGDISANIQVELYYDDYGYYPLAPSLPSSIGNALPVTPRDPGGGIPDCEIYQWIPTYSNAQSYCVYACLEDGSFFVASKRGTFTYPVPPSTVEECES